jgi:hypothetical protein
MKHPSVGWAQEKKMIEWTGSGFDRFIALRVNRGEDLRSGVDRAGDRARVQRLKEEFIRVLSELRMKDYECDSQNLRRDLTKLMNRGCPALDVVELAYGCTSGLNPTLSDAVRCVGLTESDLVKLRTCCGWAADVISQFRELFILGPLLSHPASLPEGLSPEQFRQKIKELPNDLRILVKLLDNCPPVHNPWVDDFLKKIDFVFLGLILKFFGCGDETLSRLLRTMRHVRYIAFPDAKYLHSFDSYPVTLRNRRIKIYDPFSRTALQRGLHRFLCEDHPDAMRTMLEETVRRYFSDEWAEQRRRGETLPTLLGQIWERMLGPFWDEMPH